MIRLNKNVDWELFDYKELNNYGIDYTFTKSNKPKNGDEYSKVYGHGYISEPVDGELRTNRCYQIWHKMLRCCFANKLAKTELKGTICNEWLDFIAFQKWYSENYYEVEGERVILTRNLIKLDNTHFSPEMCVFAPQQVVGAMRTNFQKLGCDEKGNKLPLGVMYYKGNYRGLTRYNGKRVEVGAADTIDEILVMVKMVKKKELERIAEKYRKYIPEKLYRAILEFDYDYFFSTERMDDGQ